MLKKNLSVLIRLSAVAIIACCGPLGYVYFMDTGIDYSGRARLHYNWRYIFADKADFTYEYRGGLFSYSYLTGLRNNQVRVFDDKSEGQIFGDMIDVYWYKNVPEPIRSELSSMLASDVTMKPSDVFLQWLRNDGCRYLEESRHISLRDGSRALLLLVKPLERGGRGNYRYLLAEKNGVIIKAENLASSSATEEHYRLSNFVGMEFNFPGRFSRPDGGRDGVSRRYFDYFIRSFNFVNIES